jgi:hypothetical protein
MNRCSPGRRVAVAVALLPAVARATPGQFELDWSGPPECSSGEQVRAEVTRILHAPILVREGSQLSVRSTTERRDDGRFHMNLETREGGRVGKRTMDAETCNELASSAAILIAILIDPEVLSREPEVDRHAAFVSAPHSVEPWSTDASAKPSTERAPTFSAEYGVGVAIGGVGGVLPSVAPGLGLHFGIGLPAVRFEIGGLGWLSTRATIDGAGSQGADFRLLSFYAQACAYVPSRAWRVGPCAGGELEVLRGSGFGPAVTPAPNQASFGSVLAGAALRWTGARDLALVLEIDGIFPVARPSFVFSGSDGAFVYQPSRVGTRLALAAEYRFK